MNNTLVYVILIAVFILTVLMNTLPQKKAATNRDRKLSELKPGDLIITSGGCYAYVEEKSDIYLMVKMEPSGQLQKISVNAIYAFPEDFKKAEEAQKLRESYSTKKSK